MLERRDDLFRPERVLSFGDLKCKNETTDLEYNAM
jgi:hypothetical protein